MSRYLLAGLWLLALAGCADAATPSRNAPAVPSITPTSLPLPPGTLKLASGIQSQIGSLLGGSICTGSGPLHGDMPDYYQAPATPLAVSQGNMLTLSYSGQYLAELYEARFFPFPPRDPRYSGSYQPPDGRLGQQIEVTGFGPQAVLVASIPPGEYMLIVDATLQAPRPLATAQSGPCIAHPSYNFHLSVQ